MKRDIIYILAIIVLAFFLFQKKKNNFIPIGFTFPAIFHQFDTIKIFKNTKEIKIDSTYYNKWIKLVNDKSKDIAYKDAVTIREYKETFEDSIQKINVFGEVTGRLNKLSVSYDLKERKFTENVPIPQKYHLFMGGGVGVSMKDNSSVQPLYQAGLIFQNKKGNLFSLKTDHKLERVYGEYYFKFL